MQYSELPPPLVADPEFLGGGLRGGLTIGQHPQPSNDYEEDYVIGIGLRRPDFRGGWSSCMSPPRGYGQGPGGGGRDLFSFFSLFFYFFY